MRFARDRFYQLRHERWNVAPIAIEKYHDVTFWRDSVNSCSARSPVPTWRSYDTCASFTCLLGCSIGADVVNDNDFARQASCQAFADNASDRLLLVQRRDDNRDLGHCAA